jgi:hypothetical protein
MYITDCLADLNAWLRMPSVKEKTKIQGAIYE